jgi:hypothetical protein
VRPRTAGGVLRSEFIGQALDHPEILTVPETGYIKGAILEAMDDAPRPGRA